MVNQIKEDLNLEEIEEAEIVRVAGEKSKYRSLIVRFIESGKYQQKITSDFIRDTDRIAQALRTWVKRGERIKVEKRGYLTILTNEGLLDE